MNWLNGVNLSCYNLILLKYGWKIAVPGGQIVRLPGNGEQWENVQWFWKQSDFKYNNIKALDSSKHNATRALYKKHSIWSHITNYLHQTS